MSEHGEKMVHVSAKEEHQLIKDKLMLAGLPKEHAEETANHLVYADLSGINSHGAVRVEYYSERISKGGINLTPDISFEKTGSASGIFHGDNAQGHYVANLAVQPTIEMAKESGVAVVGVSRVGHTGALSYYMKQFTDANLVAISMCQSDPMVVPFGGAERYYGTNPIAFCAPSNSQGPLIFDMATTVQAWGKILARRSKGQEIPHTWAVDETGASTTDPNRVAALTPIAGPKGYGLMMMVDILSGMLLGLPTGDQVSSMYHDLTEGRNLGQIYIAIDPDRFAGVEHIKAGISKMMKDLTSMRPAPGFDSVRYPGQDSVNRYRKHLEEGIDLPESIVTYLRSDDVHYDNYDGKDAFAN